MRVLVLSNKFPYPATDGSSIAIMSLLRLMMRNQYSIHMLSLNTVKHRKDPSGFLNDYPSVKLTSLDVNTNITPFNAFINLLDGQPFHISRFFIKEVDQKIQEDLDQNSYDIVLFEGIFMAPYLDTVRLHSNAKTIVRLHNVEHKIWGKADQNRKESIVEMVSVSSVKTS